MSLSPPQFVKMLRRRDRDDLIVRLRELADKWEDIAGQNDFGQKIGEGYAKELREVLDGQTNPHT